VILACLASDRGSSSLSGTGLPGPAMTSDRLQGASQLSVMATYQRASFGGFVMRSSLLASVAQLIATDATCRDRNQTSIALRICDFDDTTLDSYGHQSYPQSNIEVEHFAFFKADVGSYYYKRSTSLIGNYMGRSRLHDVPAYRLRQWTGQFADGGCR